MKDGIFDLNSPQDLLMKLKHDYQLMEKHPFDTYLAFNFFVSAEAMLDWLYPGKENKKIRESLRYSEVLIQITSHLASGAKHFSNLSSHHDTINDTTRTVGYFNNYFPKGYIPSGYFGNDILLIYLDGDAAIKFGKTITALELAEKVLIYWETSTHIP